MEYAVIAFIMVRAIAICGGAWCLWVGVTSGFDGQFAKGAFYTALAAVLLS